MSGIALITKQLRREKLLDLLPEYGFDLRKAAVAAGYSEHYAKKRLPAIIRGDGAFCELILAKRRAIDATSGDRREKALRKLDLAMEQPNLRPMELARLVEVQGKMCGWMNETVKLETPERQRELDEAQAQAAREFALWRGDTSRLPGDARALPGEADEQDRPE